jgi:CRP-like cAMP-binding protein/small-conductance mechanosensitive channel
MNIALGWSLFVCLGLSIFFWWKCPPERRRLLAGWIFALLAGVFALAFFNAGQTWLALTAEAFAQLAILQILSVGIFRLALGRWKIPLIVPEILLLISYLWVIFHLLSRVGVNITGLIATSAVITAVIGLSMQEMLLSVVGGIVLQMEGKIGHGEYIRTAHGSGFVREVRIRYTSIETPNNDIILIPNNLLNKQEVTIVALKHRRLIRFALDYGNSPSTIIGIVNEALAASPIPEVADYPQPKCVLLSYNPQFVRYGVLAYLTNRGFEYVGVSEILARVHFALGRAGIPLTSIANSVNLRRSPSQAETAAAEAERLFRLDTLRSNDVFGVLSEGELHHLAERMKRLTYGPGEVVVRQGDEADSLYVVNNGRLRVMLRGEEEGSRNEEVAMLEPGAVFGEMSLLLGGKRTASVIAVGQVECDRLDKEVFAEVVHNRPGVLDQICAVLADRYRGLAEARERLSVAASAEPSDFLTLIQSFFGIGKRPR